MIIKIFGIRKLEFLGFHTSLLACRCVQTSCDRRLNRHKALA